MATRYRRLLGGRVGLLEIRTGLASAPSLLCFSHAGGSPRAFEALARELPSQWAIYAAEPPGRVSTSGSPPTSVAEMVSHYLEALPSALLDSVLIGHSLGGYVALTLCQALSGRARGLVIAATTPPHTRSSTSHPSSLSDRELLRWLQEISENPSTMPSEAVFAHFAPVLRADLAAYEGFPSHAHRLPLGVPALLCGGRSDPLCSELRFKRWRELLPQAELRSVAGGHFFVQANPAPFAAELRRFVARLPERSTALGLSG